MQKCTLLIGKHSRYLKARLLLHAILAIILKRDVGSQVLRLLMNISEQLRLLMVSVASATGILSVSLSIIIHHIFKFEL